MSELWPPTSKESLELAVANGMLVENHFLDLKRQLPPPNRNQDLAIDLAAFSVDGGTLFVGVSEGRSGPSISPIPLMGLAERLEQIGLSSVDPPVQIRSHPIETGPKPGDGVLVVIVPPSPAAPHMVAGQYRGRADKTNYVMGDAEVSRIRDDLEDRAAEIEELLSEYATTAYRTHRNGPLLLAVARPTTARPELLLTCAGADPLAWVTTALVNTTLTRTLIPRFGPDFTRGQPAEPRANGWAVGKGAEAELDLELHEDGLLRLRCGRLIHNMAFDRIVNDVALIGLVKRLVLTAAEIGRVCSHFGAWNFAISVAPLRNYRAESATSRGLDSVPYSEDGYSQSTVATFEELSADPDAPLMRLVGQLSRSLAGPAAIIPT